MSPYITVASLPKPSVPTLSGRLNPDTKRTRILVVDDVTGIREVMAAVLEQAGYCVTCAEDGEMAWDAICADEFDLVITDHDMPRLTGMGLLRRIRAVPFSLPVILMSGRIPYEDEDISELTQPGMIIGKPFSFVVLLENVRSVLTQSTPPAGWGDRARISMPSAI